MGLTQDQQRAVEARGNVLVVAGAGTGKTSTLVERCLSCLLEEKPPVSLEQILMVTFTEAAAADLRRRIRQRLELELDKERAKQSTHPGTATRSGHWQEQLALFETAHIGTLHSFCFQLVRQHFYELELDPQLAVLPEEEAQLLADETLDDTLQQHYAGNTGNAREVQKLIQAQGGGSDRPIRALVLRLHHYTQTLPDPSGWINQQFTCFQPPEPVLWTEWLAQGLASWRQFWLPTLETEFPGNGVAAACAFVLKQSDSSGPAFASALEALLTAAEDYPKGKKGAWVDPLEDFFKDVRFLSSLTGKTAALAEDWEWVRGQMKTLLELAREFAAAFRDSKHELGVVDYHDLEQYALRLLWDPKTNRPTPTAFQWREKLRFVFVDEYQDINAAQDRIIEALGREGAHANRFLVGDVKQSIYRFRLANPRIFQNYIALWQDRPNQQRAGRTIPLSDNFRSREGLLQFINSVFGLVMRAELGGVPYDEQAQLRFGAPAQRAPLSLSADPSPCVELHLHVQRGNAEAEGESDEALAQVADLERAGKEARLLALRLRELKAQRHRVWDEQTGQMRPVEWSDMAVLLRAPSNKADSYAREFSRLEVPLQVARGGFYDSLEVSDLLNLLRLLDNPLQDLPLLAVLRSPLAGLTLDELATIRLSNKGSFWNALVQWSQIERDNPELFRKTTAWLERYARWRRLARQVSLTRCLDTVLAETRYADWVLTQERGEQRGANLQRLAALARQFDQFQRQGLFRFLHFIEAQKRAESEPIMPPVSAGNAVRLMSIHQSKGLEFPVVAVADLAKPFNLADLRADLILDEEYGLCPRVTPPHTGQSYPSLPYWLASKRQTRELLGEELRLLYVAMTRARDTLLLSASVSGTKFNQLWTAGAPGRVSSLFSARNYADWLCFWFGKCVQPEEQTAAQGRIGTMRWFFHDDARLTEAGAELAQEPAESERQITTDSDSWRKLQKRLFWTYPFREATRWPAKTSVSMLRRLAAEPADEEGQPLFAATLNLKARPSRFVPPRLRGPGRGANADNAAQASAADLGTAHHAFLQHVALDHAGSMEELRGEAQRMQQQGVLAEEQVAMLDYQALANFWTSELGRRVRAQARFVRRELPFTARFSPQELAILVGKPATQELEDEFIVVQGVADLAVLLADELWLIDFKTDDLEPAEVADRAKVYEPQLKLYARALARIHRRVVSESWLCFLAAGQAVRVDEVPSLPKVSV